MSQIWTQPSRSLYAQYEAPGDAPSNRSSPSSSSRSHYINSFCSFWLIVMKPRHLGMPSEVP